MLAVENFRVQVYCDGVINAEHLNLMLDTYPYLKGFTTNPSLMRQAGVVDYKRWAKELLDETTLPISFEVLADDWREIERQAMEIASWGENAFVKVPVQTSKGVDLCPGIHLLNLRGVKVNVTAVMTLDQIDRACAAMMWRRASQEMAGIISVFAGRISDTGLDPYEHIRAAHQQSCEGHAVLWASTRSVYDVQRADEAGADIITCSPEILAKLPLLGKNLDEYSRETVEMFVRDGKRAGYVL